MTGRCKTEYIVTGATGFLGGAVVRELISRGHSVTALALPEDPLLPLLPEGAAPSNTSRGRVMSFSALSDVR